jgi:CubicO group peptidase (beta-lactamase class C family)
MLIMTTSVQWPFVKAEPESVGFSSQRLSQAAALVDRFVAENRVSGGVVAVARNGRLAHLSTHGWQNMESRIPMRPDSIFRVYSMTKPMTSACVMQLFEQGKLGLEQEVRAILPCFDRLRIYEDVQNKSGALVPPERAPTVYDLLRHMAGISYSPMYPIESPGDVNSLEEFVDRLCDQPMIEQPGKRWIYSLAVDVLGRIIEVVSGLPFDVYMQKHLFAPLGMTDTAFFVPDEKADRFCCMYTDKENAEDITLLDGATRDSQFRNKPVFPSGGGGLTSTTGDIMRFCSALKDGGSLGETRILGRKTVEFMCTDHLPPEHPAIRFTGKNLRIGLGVSVVRNLGESACIGSVGEFGWGGAAGTMEWIDPAEDMVVLLMIQHRGLRAKDLEHRFKAALYSALL